MFELFCASTSFTALGPCFLFQTSTKRAVETTDITRSFGWDSSDGKLRNCIIFLTVHFCANCTEVL